MEAPRFFNNKTRAFSSALLAMTMAACGGKSSGAEKPQSPAPLHPTSTVRPIETPTPESESKVNVIISYYLNSEAPDLPLDENCGHWLLPGDKSTFSTPLPPGNKTLTFDAEVTLQPGVPPLYGGLPAVPNKYLKAEIQLPQGIAILPLGEITGVEPTRLYFTPYLPANGRPNPDCVKQQPPAY